MAAVELLVLFTVTAIANDEAKMKSFLILISIFSNQAFARSAVTVLEEYFFRATEPAEITDIAEKGSSTDSPQTCVIINKKSDEDQPRVFKFYRVATRGSGYGSLFPSINGGNEWGLNISISGAKEPEVQELDTFASARSMQITNSSNYTLLEFKNHRYNSIEIKMKRLDKNIVMEITYPDDSYYAYCYRE
jgi:hypothetical protein